MWAVPERVRIGAAGERIVGVGLGLWKPRIPRQPLDLSRFGLYGVRMTSQTQQGARFRAARRATFLNQTDLATSVGTDQRTISRIENGLQSPKADLLTKLCGALEVSADWLLVGAGEGVARGGSRARRHTKREGKRAGRAK